MTSIIRFASPLVTIEEVVCEGATPERGPEEQAQRPEIVFPRRGVFVRHNAAGRAVADPNHILFFNSGQPYQVSHPVAGGDCCLIFALQPAALLALIRSTDASVDDRPDQPFAHDLALAETRQRLRQHHLHQFLRLAPHPEALQVEEQVLELLAEVLGPLSAPPIQLGRAQIDLVEAVTLVLNARFAEKLTLTEVASAVHSSPFHLSRVFRRVVGLSIHQYLRRLRLLTLLARLADDPRAEIAPLAVDCGFDSHSHAASVCQQVFGQPPSVLRRAPAGAWPSALPRQPRNILKA